MRINSNVNGYRKQTPIYSGAKVVGQVRGEVFWKSIYGSKHFLRRPPAIGFDIACLLQAEKAGAVRVEVLDKETGIIYEASIDHIWENGIIIDRGFGVQIALLLNRWVNRIKGS